MPVTKMCTTTSHGRAVLGAKPGRYLVCGVRCAATSIPLLPSLGNRAKATKHQPVASPETSIDDQRSDYSASASQMASGPVETVPVQHHVRMRGRQFVLGSPPGLLGGSHTQPANTGLAAHGCYRVIGPARISKRGDCLVARLYPGSRLELLSSGGGCATAVQAVSEQLPPSEARATPVVGAEAALPKPLSHSMVMDAAAAGFHDWDLDSAVQCACACGDGSSSRSGSSGDEDPEESEDDGAVTECVLVASYVELGGSASSMDTADAALQPAVLHHNGHTYLSVRNMPYCAVITLSADGDLSHPVNVTPSEPPQQQQNAAAVTS